MYTASPLPQDAVHEAAASLESRLRHAVLLTSEVDVRVILNARTALMTELEGREEVWPGPLVPDACVCHLHGTSLNDKAGSRVRTIPPRSGIFPSFFFLVGKLPENRNPSQVRLFWEVCPPFEKCSRLTWWPGQPTRCESRKTFLKGSIPQLWYTRMGEG